MSVERTRTFTGSSYGQEVLVTIFEEVENPLVELVGGTSPSKILGMEVAHRDRDSGRWGPPTIVREET